MSTESSPSKGTMFITVVMALIIVAIVAYLLVFTEIIISHDDEDAREADRASEVE